MTSSSLLNAMNVNALCWVSVLLQSNSRPDNVDKGFRFNFSTFPPSFPPRRCFRGQTGKAASGQFKFQFDDDLYIMMMMIMVIVTTKLIMMVVVMVVVIMMMIFRAFRKAGSGQFKFQFEEEMGASQSHQTIQGQPPSALILWFSLLSPPPSFNPKPIPQTNMWEFIQRSDTRHHAMFFLWQMKVCEITTVPDRMSNAKIIADERFDT